MERRFIRHPAGCPIRFRVRVGALQSHDRLRDIGEGGLCFAASTAVYPGTPVSVSIPVLGQVFEADATVAWCQPSAPGFQVGVRFSSPQQLLCVRMVEQLCYIEDYRTRVERQEGRILDDEQAADEWIERIAARFPSVS